MEETLHLHEHNLHMPFIFQGRLNTKYTYGVTEIDVDRRVLFKEELKTIGHIRFAAKDMRFGTKKDGLKETTRKSHANQ